MINVCADTTRLTPNMPQPDQDALRDIRRSLLERSGLLHAGQRPELDRWTAVLRRATGSAVAALAVPLGDRTLISGLWIGDADEPEVTELGPGESLEQFLSARIGAPAWADGLHSHIDDSVVVDGHVLCTVGVADAAPRDWDSRDMQILDDTTAAIASEIRLCLANDEALRFHELVASQQRVHELIAGGAPLGDVLVELVQGLERHDPSVIPCVVLLDPASNTLHPGAGPSLPHHYLSAIDGVVIGPNVGTCGSAAWSGQLTISDDIATDAKWAPIRDFVLDAGLRHCWSMPIKAPAGEVLGTLAFYGHRPRRPLPAHLTLLEDGARLAGIAIERHRALEQLIYDARHDGLTGLPNRTAIFELLDDAIVRVQPRAALAVLFVDLDGLKALNDTLGHDRADEMIREVSQRLSAAVRGSDFVGRFGGDEFVVVAEGVADEEEAAKLGFRLLEAVSQPLPGIDSTVVTASIGITLLSDSESDAREALRQADAAMYEAKRSGRDRISFFGGSRRNQEGRRLALVRELRGAEMRGELGIVFQPVFELETGEVAGVEALLRWNSPVLGPVAPAEFIPVAEDTGMIVPIGSWVLRESCETMHRIAARAGRPVELAVNVSAHQLSHPGFAQSVLQTVAHAEFPADQLVLEMARALGCSVTAEGVETEDQLSALRLLECERVQGFLLGRPKGPEELAALLAAPRRGVTRPTAATSDPVDLRQIARTRHLRGPAPGQSRRPAALRRLAGR
jgi:diguanylate cyclase (GGDEF)-like protein